MSKIKLFIYDKFFDAFSMLPQGIQKKTREFIKKFRENPTSASINYEKISTFKDKNLRTVRIDLNYRAILHSSENDNHFHLLWVDNHDEAMNWAKNKTFDWNRETQTAQIFEIEERIKTIDIQANEYTEKSFFSNYSDEQILKIGVPELQLGIVKNIRNLDDLEKLTDVLPTDAFDNIYYLMDGVPIQNILQDIENGKSIDAETNESINSKRNFVLITEDAQLDEMLSGNFIKWKIFLHPAQHIVAYSNYKGSVKISGGAGTGKTVAALHRAKYLTERLSTNDLPVFFTTYTKSLIKNLETLITEMNIDKRKIYHKNIHAYIREFAEKNNLISKDTKLMFEVSELEVWKDFMEFHVSRFSEQFLCDEYNQIIVQNNVKSLEEYLQTPRINRSGKIGRQDKIEIWKLVAAFQQSKQKENKISFNELFNLATTFLNENADKKPFSYIICDELQDFSNIELRFIRALVVERENDLFLVGDPLQNIYNKRLNFSLAGINVKGNRSKQLKINYRTTEEIKKLAIATIKDIDFDDFDGETESKKGYRSLLHGKQPIYKIFDNATDEIDFIYRTVCEYLSGGKINHNQICIAVRNHDLANGIKTRFYKEHLQFADVSNDNQNESNYKIQFSTFHNTKGLEFKRMILAGVNAETVPHKPYDFNNWEKARQNHYLKSEAALLYVAMTRAIEELVITGTGAKSELVKG